MRTMKYIKIRDRYRLLLTVLFLLVYQLSCGQQKTDPEIYTLWTGEELPGHKDIPVIENVKFHLIKAYEPEDDGYRFLHGVAIVRFNDRWFASFGHNKGPENTGSEEAKYMISKNGKKWKAVKTLDDPSGDLAASHGVFLKRKDTLWAFMGSFHRVMENVHTNAYTWDEQTCEWVSRGVVAEDGFWPLQEPRQMENGDWIMAGASIGGKNPPAVALCKDGDFTRWEVVRVPTPVKVWGESTVIVDGSKVILIARSSQNTPKFEGYGHPLAWVAVSNDYGRTWSELQPSNLPMATSKPYSGTLSNGQRYLIGSSSADGRRLRRPLTIAVSRPGENTFSKIFAIRGAAVTEKKVESDPDMALAYPYAVEYEGDLWVVYSNSGGRSGSKRAMWNNNSAELAIVPIEALKVE